MKGAQGADSVVLRGGAGGEGGGGAPMLSSNPQRSAWEVGGEGVRGKARVTGVGTKGLGAWDEVKF